VAGLCIAIALVCVSLCYLFYHRGGRELRAVFITSCQDPPSDNNSSSIDSLVVSDDPELAMDIDISIQRRQSKEDDSKVGDGT
jgi:hypothetical protein